MCLIKELNIENMNDVTSVFTHPIIIKKLEEIDEPGQFLSVITSLIKIKINKNKGVLHDIKFYTPIRFDATCNGLQHLSTLFLDIQSAIDSNVIQSEGSRDLYSEVANNLTQWINKQNPNDFISKLKKINFNRTIMKKPVMTVPYNVGLNSMTDQLVNLNIFSKN
jgi:DNA-directed RNA polymerase, mitochondrial